MAGSSSGYPVMGMVLRSLNQFWTFFRTHIQWNTSARLPRPPDNVTRTIPNIDTRSGRSAWFLFSSAPESAKRGSHRARIQAMAKGMPRFARLPANPADLSDWQAEIKRRIQIILGPFPQKSPLQTRIFNQVWEDGMMAERITFQSEAASPYPVCSSCPRNGITRYLL